MHSGTKVKIREDLIPGEIYGNIELLPGMFDYLGAEDIIIYSGLCDNNWHLENTPFTWSEKMLEEVK